MPELPEVETVRRGLSPVMEGRRLKDVTLNRADLRFPLPERMADRLTGQTILSLGRRAKYLTFSLSSGETLIAHLGMSGSFRIDFATLNEDGFHFPRGKMAAHDHVLWTLDDGTVITYNDPRRFGFMDLVAGHALSSYPAFAKLGPEPVGNALSGAYLFSQFNGKKTAVKLALLDQSIIAGLGNIYVCEALFRARVSPFRLARDVSLAECEALTSHIRDVISEAIVAGGSSLRDYVQTDGSLGYFQHRFQVYDRGGEPCPHAGCGGQIERRPQGGRSSFFCATCQL